MLSQDPTPLTGQDPAMIPAWVDGRLIPVEKLEVHQRGLRHPAVSVFVRRGGRILLQQRALGKYHTPGLWANTCCTHPMWGEAPLACAERRLGQELGITGLAPVPRGQVEYRADVGSGLTEHELVDIFVAEAGADMPLAPNRAEVMATRWASLAEIADDLARTPDSFTPWMRVYMADHAKAIFGALAK